jgi:hypothetical protein
VRAKAYFLAPEERPRHRDVDLRDPLLRYELLADLFYDKPQRLLARPAVR